MSKTFSSPAWSAVECAAFDAYLQAAGIPPGLLMENAAGALSRRILGLLGNPATARPKRVLFVIGPGNNGADGVVAARQLLGRPGVQSEVLLMRDEPASGSLLESSLQALRQLNSALETGQVPLLGRLDLDAALERADLLVDALFGVGLDRPLQGDWAAAIDALNRAARPILAVDVPSGLDSTSGEILGCAIRATATLSFIGPKAGFRMGAGPSHCGHVEVADIGVPAAFATAWLARRRAEA